MEDFVKWAVENLGLLGAILLILILSGDKIAARLGSLIPPLGDWLDKGRRERVRAETDDREHTQQMEEVVTHHSLDTLAAQLQLSARREDAALAMIREVIGWAREDGNEQRKELLTIRERVASLHVALVRMDDLILILSGILDKQNILLTRILDRLEIPRETD